MVVDEEKAKSGPGDLNVEDRQDKKLSGVKYYRIHHPKHLFSDLCPVGVSYFRDAIWSLLSVGQEAALVELLLYSQALSRIT